MSESRLSNDKVTIEVEQLEVLKATSEIGKAFLWALGEGLINNVAVKPLVKKYQEAAGAAQLKR